MFQNLSKRLSSVFDKLRGRGVITEEDLNAALREIRIALLEGDVALPVVKTFIEQVKEKALGQHVIKGGSVSVTHEQMIVKIVHDHLVEILGKETVGLNFNTPSPAVIMLVGLQGSGKTTSTGKLAKFIQEKYHKKVLMASLDIYRPAAQEQLAILGEKLNLSTLDIIAQQKPLGITERALQKAKKQGFDVLLLDTAGRLHIDEALMDELKRVKQIAQPIETLLVADSMTGQDAVNIAKTFHEQVGLTGIVLTRVDGDARGGAALSMRFITGCPIKFMGVGEKLNQLEVFQPDRIANRILDMGDIVGFVEKAAEIVQDEQAQKTVERMQKGVFTLEDMALQLQQMMKMGGVSSILTFLPGLGQLKDKISQSGLDDKLIKHQLAIIQSMTKKERRNPSILNASRRRRIALGCGQTVAHVNKLLKQFEQMQQVMKKMGKFGAKGLWRSGLKNLFLR
ncbi:MAG: signal recognition particle protein [Proteobacteria bacterium]|nr:signal recognition particle protein [Pseudomonadota bacterium]